jgi:hypothetical protein
MIIKYIQRHKKRIIIIYAMMIIPTWIFSYIIGNCYGQGYPSIVTPIGAFNVGWFDNSTIFGAFIFAFAGLIMTEFCIDLLNSPV